MEVEATSKSAQSHQVLCCRSGHAVASCSCLNCIAGRMNASQELVVYLRLHTTKGVKGQLCSEKVCIYIVHPTVRRTFDAIIIETCQEALAAPCTPRLTRL